jgi:putative DNA primase/helicase
MTKPDINVVAAHALRCIDNVLAHLLPDGKREGSEYKARNPTRADNKTGSFSVNINTGAWADFATGDKGGDLVSLWAYVRGCKNQGEAAQQLADYIGTTPQEIAPTKSAGKGGDWRPVLPVPDTAPAPPVQHYKHGKAAACWDYRGATGALLLRVNRYNTGKDDNGKMQKEFCPQTWCELYQQGKPTGRKEWRWKMPDAPRPLYGLDRLAARHAAPVLLCEGEKAADAGALLLPDFVAMAWPGGANAVNKADFAPLAGRAVTFWPDNDTAGDKAKHILGAALQLAGVASMQLINIKAFSVLTPAGDTAAPELLHQTARWGAGDDAADAVALGWTAAHVQKLAADGALFLPFVAGKGEADGVRNHRTAGTVANEARGNNGDATPPMFRANEAGVFWYTDKQERYIQICDWLEVVAHSRSKPTNRESRGWGKLVRFKDRDGGMKQWNIPDAMFAGEGMEVTKGLLDRGLKIFPHQQATRKLQEYLRGVEVPDRVQLVDKMGWHENAFMLPDCVIGTPLELLHYYADAVTVCKMARAGTLEGWRDNVASHAVGNDLVALAISAAFAAPLLDILARPTVGFHFYGSSSWGKSTLLGIAASVCGAPGQHGYGHTWRATDNAIESMAAAHSDCLFILDELKQCDSRVVGQTVYMLGNGEGKARSAETGVSVGARHRWRLVVLSNGELTLAEHLSEAKLKAHAGQEMRLLHIEANFNATNEQRARCGIYQDVRDFAGGAALSAHILGQAAKHHGTAFPAFLEKLLEPGFIEGKGRAWITGKVASFQQQALSSGASGQASRAADAFGLVAAAGEMATRFGITGWADGVATKAALQCFRAWIEYRGGEGDKESRDMLEAVRLHFAMYGESHYSRMNEGEPVTDDHAPRTMMRYGFRRTTDTGDNMAGRTTETVYFVMADPFRKEICKGYNYKHVAELLEAKGALARGDKDHLYQKRVLPGTDKKRVPCYVINLGALFEDSDDETAEAA